jgi:hypothetical protein
MTMHATRFLLVGIVLGLGLSSAGCESGDEGAEVERSPIFAGSIRTSRFNQDGLAQLEGVQVVTGDLRLSGVESLAALSSLVHVHGSLIIEANADLKSLAGLEKLTRVNGDFAIVGAPSVRSLEELGALEQVGGAFSLSGLTVTDLTGLSKLRSIGGDLAITHNSGLESLVGLDSLSSVGGSLDLTGNDMLASARLAEHGDGPSLGGHVHVLDNPKLRELEGFGYLSPGEEACRSGHEDIFIADNEQLESITLPSLIGRRPCVTIFDNPALTALAGNDNGAWDTLTLLELPRLSTIDLHFHEIRVLDITKTGLTSLDGLGPVSCKLSVLNNPALASLSDFATFPGQVAESVMLSDNASLSQCAVDRMLKSLRDPTVRCVDPFSSTTQLTRFTDGKNNNPALACAAPAS